MYVEVKYVYDAEILLWICYLPVKRIALNACIYFKLYTDSVILAVTIVRALKITVFFYCFQHFVLLHISAFCIVTDFSIVYCCSYTVYIAFANLCIVVRARVNMGLLFTKIWSLFGNEGKIKVLLPLHYTPFTNSTIYEFSCTFLM